MAQQKQPSTNQTSTNQTSKHQSSKKRSFLQVAASGLSVVRKDFGVTAVGDTGWNAVRGGSQTRYPGSDIDWHTKAGSLLLNSVVSLCVQYTIDKIAEPRVRAVYEGPDAMLQPIPKHPATQLLETANPEYRGRQLLGALALSYKLNGNAYAIKVRGPGGLGTPRELWYVPHWRMTPLEPEDGGPTQFYKLTYPGSVKTKIYPRADVIHLRNGLDPSNPRLGLSPFRAQLRGIVSDNEIDTYTAVVLENFGMLGALISPASDDVEVTPDQADELKRRMLEATTGDARGRIVVPNVAIKVDHASRSPQDMALTTMGDRPMQRICATFGIDPAAIGLAALTGEKYGTLRKEARASSYEQCILPMLAVFAEGWTQDLLPDFLLGDLSTSMGAAPADVFIEYDYSQVRDMQEDSDAVHKRARDDFKGNGITLDEFRSRIGLKPAVDAELGEKFQFQLLPAPGGAFGNLPGPDDTQTEPKGTPPDDKGDAELPKEEDKD